MPVESNQRPLKLLIFFIGLSHLLFKGLKRVQILWPNISYSLLFGLFLYIMLQTEEAKSVSHFLFHHSLTFPVPAKGDLKDGNQN